VARWAAVSRARARIVSARTAKFSSSVHISSPRKITYDDSVMDAKSGVSEPDGRINATTAKTTSATPLTKLASRIVRTDLLNDHDITPRRVFGGAAAAAGAAPATACDRERARPSSAPAAAGALGRACDSERMRPLPSSYDHGFGLDDALAD